MSMDEKPGGQVSSSALFDIGLQRLAKTESDQHASLTGSAFSIPTATLAYERFNCVL